MNLSSIASALGAGFKGYGEDQQEATQNARNQRILDAEDEDRLNRLKLAGFVPSVTPSPQLNSALNAAGPTPTTGGPSAGLGASASPLDVALSAQPKAPPATPSVPTATVTTANGPQNLTFDYDSSPQGQQERRQRAEEAQKAQEAAALAKQKADEANQIRQAAQTRAYGNIKTYFADDPLAKAPFDADANDYVTAFADMDKQDRDTKAEIAKTKAQLDAENNKIRDSTDKETGETTYSRYNPKLDRMVPILGAQPTPKAGGFAGGGAATGAQVPLDDMLDRFSEISQHADAVAKGQFPITRAYQTREGVAYGIARENASGQGIPVKQMAVAEAQDALPVGMGGVDPKDPNFLRYQALMNSQRALGDDVAKVFKGRQNEDAVLREVALAQLTPDDYRNPAVVAQKMDRLKNVIKLAAIGNPQQVAATKDPQRLFNVTGIRAPSTVAGAGGRNNPSGMPNPQADAQKQAQRKARWDALVSGGMEKNAATQQVMREIP